MSPWAHPVLSILLAAVVLFAVGVGLLAAEAERRDIAVRIDVLTFRRSGPARRGVSLKAGLVGFLAGIGRTALDHALVSQKDVLALEGVMRTAGFSGSSGVLAFIGAKCVLMLAGPGLAWGYAALSDFTSSNRLLAAAGALAACLLIPNWLLGTLRSRFTTRLRMGLPDALDLMVVCTEAGLGLETTVERVALELRTSNRAVAAEFALLVQEMRMLPSRTEALVRMGERTGIEGYVRLAATLSQTLRFGTPLGQSLRLLSGEMRQDRLVLFEEKAARLPALLVMPLLLFIMPCLFIILIGPSMLELFKSM